MKSTPGTAVALSAFAITLAVAGAGNAVEAPAASVEGTAIQSLIPGSTLSRENPELARALLPPELALRVMAGELEIRVAETTELPESEAYLEATRSHAGRVVLRDDGSLGGYVAGRPFPVLDLEDPQCGLKAAWNLRYHDAGRGMEVEGVFRVVRASGKVDQEIEFLYARAYGMHRPGENRWEEEKIYYKEFYQAIAPLRVRNLMNLRHRYDDDGRVDDNWSYNPGEGKIRKTVQLQEESTMGSDLLREDYYGFSGYLRNHEWRCVGRGAVIAPVGIEAAHATLDPKRFFPSDPWQLRQVLILEATPKNPDHPYGRRVLYVDQQIFAPLYVLIFGHDGAHEKTLFTLYADPHAVPGQERARVPIWLAEVMINHRSGDATITEVSGGRFDVQVSEERFEREQMSVLGR